MDNLEKQSYFNYPITEDQISKLDIDLNSATEEMKMRIISNIIDNTKAGDLRNESLKSVLKKHKDIVVFLKKKFTTEYISRKLKLKREIMGRTTTTSTSGITTGKIELHK